MDLTGTDAIATIQNASIPAAQSDGLVPGPTAMAPRTFGEMQLDLDFIFDEDTCESFGSAFVKSRSSDSFTSQLKDFIKPIPVNITNCGKVIIRKQTNPDEDPEVTEFDFTKSFDTDPATDDEFTLMDDGVATYTGVLIGDDYTVTEDALPAGWDFPSLDCSASENVTPVIAPGSDTVTFDIDNAADVLDCTYTNRARGTIVIEKITDDGEGPFGFTSTTLTPASWTLTTTAPLAAGKDSKTFADLAPGMYDATETLPAGWNLVSSTCSDTSLVSAISLQGGETVTCTFHNAREQGAIDILKMRKHAAAPGTDDVPHPGVTFTVTGGDLPEAGVTAVTNASGHACVSGLVLSSFVGNYTVTESVPDGYNSTDAEQTVAVTAESAGCGPEAPAPASPDADVSFLNIPLTDVTVSVDSQVARRNLVGDRLRRDRHHHDRPGPADNGDGSVTVTDLEPTAPAVTLTCTITVDP